MYWMQQPTRLKRKPCTLVLLNKLASQNLKGIYIKREIYKSWNSLRSYSKSTSKNLTILGQENGNVKPEKHTHTHTHTHTINTYWPESINKGKATTECRVNREAHFHAFLISVLDSGEWSISHSRLCTHGEWFSNIHWTGSWMCSRLSLDILLLQSWSQKPVTLLT
jgi:hypothetical protein